jgi:hypothetical protein
VANKVGTLLVEIAGSVGRLEKDMGKANKILMDTQRKFKRALGGIGVTIVAAFSVRAITNWASSVIDAGDAVQKTAQKIGMSTADLSTFTHAAKLSGASMEQLKTGLVIFSKTTEAQSKGIKRALMDVADEFKAMPDSAEKTARAVQLFGRSGSDLIPFLNQGSDGLAKLQDEARRLGIELDDTTANAMAAFKDELTRLKAAGDGLGIAIAKELMPGLTTISKLMTEGAISGNMLAGSWKALKAVFSDKAMREAEAEVGDVAMSLELLQERMAEVRRGIAVADEGITKGWWGTDFKAIRAQLVKELDELEQIEDMHKTDLDQAKARDRAKEAAKAAAGRDAENAKRIAAMFEDLEEQVRMVDWQTQRQLAEWQEYYKAMDKLSVAWNRDQEKRMEEQARAEADRLRDMHREWERQQDRARQKVQKFSSDAGSAFADMAMGGKHAFRDMVNSWLRDALRAWSMRQIFTPIFGGIFGDATPAPAAPSNLGQGPGGFLGMPMMASGGVTRGPSIAGEAGPEAVLPLQRTPSGELGVKGSVGGDVKVTVIDQRQRGEPIRPEVRQSGGGRELVVFVRDAVETSVADGSLDRVMSQAYGLRRAGVRR